MKNLIIGLILVAIVPASASDTICTVTNGIYDNSPLVVKSISIAHLSERLILTIADKTFEFIATDYSADKTSKLDLVLNSNPNVKAVLLSKENPGNPKSLNQFEALFIVTGLVVNTHKNTSIDDEEGFTPYKSFVYNLNCKK